MATSLEEPRARPPQPPAPSPAAEPRADAPVRPAPRALVFASELSWRFLVIVAALLVVALVVSRISFVVVPVMIALLAATLLVPPARWLRRRGLPAALATAIVFLSAIGAFAFVIYEIAPPVVDEFGLVGEQARTGVGQLGDYLANGPLGLDPIDVQTTIQRAENRLRENASRIVTGVLNGAQIAFQVIATVFLTLVLLFFFVKDGRRLWLAFVGLWPPRRRETVEEVGEVAWRVLGGYVRGVASVAAVDAVFIGLGLLVIGVPFVLPLAVLTFIAAFVPFVGAIVAGALAALVALVSNGAVAALLVVGVVTLVQQLEGNVLQPLLVGRSVELHPVVVLLAVTIGGVLAGILGAALAVPIAAVIIGTIGVLRRHADEIVIDDEVAPPAPS